MCCCPWGKELRLNHILAGHSRAGLRKIFLLFSQAGQKYHFLRSEPSRDQLRFYCRLSYQFLGQWDKADWSFSQHGHTNCRRKAIVRAASCLRKVLQRHVSPNISGSSDVNSRTPCTISDVALIPRQWTALFHV